jgi:serine/threonine protein kinase
LVQERKKKRKSKGSIDWWLDGFSGEFRNGRRNSQDWASGEIPKSGGISSTPSMRGTVCYIAPEYGGGGLLSEKCDVYSFGVLLLVVVSGRRPLQVTASPMSEFERANLISWARQLAYNGKLLDLVDPSILSLDKDQALLCITIGLLCLQRSPSKRPTVKEIVGMLSGEAEPPHLPFEFSPSPPSNFPFKSPRKAR